MKSINMKIKSIYLLAIMAIISVCLAVFPVFKTETVKAEDAELSMTGAYVEFSKANDADDFALMFQAEITKTFVDSKAGQNVKFGMAIGPAANLSGVTSYADFAGLGNKVVVFDNLVDIADLDIDEDATTFAYEAGTYFNKNEVYVDSMGENVTITPAQWKVAYTKDLTAIPFYTVEGNAPVLKASITRNASQVVFDTFLAETTLPVNSPERTVSDAAFTAITGRSLKSSYGSDEVIYLNMDTNQFFTNFLRGGQTFSNLKQLQRWWPSIAYTGTNWQLGTNKNNPTYFAGGEFTTAFTAETGAFSASNFTNLAGIKKLTPGGKYRVYYIPQNSESEMVYFTYTAASQVFGINAPQGKGTMGSFTQLGIKDKATDETATIKWFFAYGVSSSNIYMPYTRTSATTAYNKNAYDGYYVLMSDWVFDGVSGMAFVYQGSSAGGTQATVATDKAQTPAAASFGALKNLPNYHTKFNTAVKQAAFTGTFDGAGHTIDASFTRGGLFGYIDGGTIKNVNIKADFYTYAATSTTAAGYANTSYMEKAAVLAEVIENATIENVAIKLVENAPTTFEYKQDYLGEDSEVLTYDNIPEMDNVPGIVASQVIENSTLKNVIVRCDSLKDAGNSLQNFRAALNLGTGNTLENVFVIGSSYTNMSIDETADAYVLTLSAPEGIESGEYVNDGTIPASYFEMAEDMFKYMRNVDVTAKTIKVKFIAEKATKKFATEEAFQTYINSEAGAEAKAALIGSEMWYEVDGNLVWAGFIAYSPKDGAVEAHGSEPVLCSSSSKVVGGYYAMKGSHTLGAKPTLDTSEKFQWGISYNPRVTVAG